MKRLETPQMLNDIYRDLRDRRLLIPAVALLVAIVAVPFVLAQSEEPAAAPAAATVPEGASEVSAAVLVEDSGIRNYRERLGALKAQNPFEEKFSAPKSPSGDEEAGDSSAGEATSTAVTPVASANGVSTDPPVADAGGSSPSTPTPSTPDTDDNESSPNSGNTRKPEIRFVVGRVDVAFGPVGDAQEIDDVRELDFIPGDKNPIASFIGLAGNGDRAVFGLTPSVIDTRGDGSCSPKGACQFLRLGEGDTHYLKTDGGKTFKLTLVATHLVPIADPRKDD